MQLKQQLTSDDHLTKGIQYFVKQPEEMQSKLFVTEVNPTFLAVVVLIYIGLNHKILTFLPPFKNFISGCVPNIVEMRLTGGLALQPYDIRLCKNKTTQ